MAVVSIPELARDTAEASLRQQLGVRRDQLRSTLKEAGVIARDRSIQQRETIDGSNRVIAEARSIRPRIACRR